MSVPSSSPPSVAVVLEEAIASQAQSGHVREAELRLVTEEIELLNKAMENIQSQVEVLVSHQAMLVASAGTQSGKGSGDVREAIFGVLHSQNKALVSRSERVHAAERDRDQAVYTSLSSSTLAPQLEEYRQFKEEVEPRLEALPASYRGVVAEHHRHLCVKLEQHFSSALSGAVEVEAALLDLDVVIAIDAPDNEDCVLIVVMPVQEQVYSEWKERSNDLQIRFALRVVQSVYRAVKGTPMQASSAMFGGHEGMLVFELDVGHCEPKVFQERLGQEIQDTIDSAPEMRAARIRARTCFLDVEILLPSESEDALESAESDPTELMQSKGGHTANIGDIRV